MELQKTKLLVEIQAIDDQFKNLQQFYVPKIKSLIFSGSY